MTKLDITPRDSNTELSGMADLFFSQWIGWILMTYTKAPEPPIYCEWYDVDQKISKFKIDYVNRSFTPILRQADGWYADDENAIRYDGLFEKDKHETVSDQSTN